jgi:hypothetical protein
MGRFAIPKKHPFREEEIEVRGKRSRHEPLPGADFRAYARHGLRGGRGEIPSEGGDLISMLFSPWQMVFRCPRGRSVFPPEPMGLLITMIGGMHSWGTPGPT